MLGVSVSETNEAIPQILINAAGTAVFENTVKISNIGLHYVRVDSWAEFLDHFNDETVVFFPVQIWPAWKPVKIL